MLINGYYFIKNHKSGRTKGIDRINIEQIKTIESQQGQKFLTVFIHMGGNLTYTLMDREANEFLATMGLDGVWPEQEKKIGQG